MELSLALFSLLFSPIIVQFLCRQLLLVNWLNLELRYAKEWITSLKSRLFTEILQQRTACKYWSCFPCCHWEAKYRDAFGIHSSAVWLKVQSLFCYPRLRWLLFFNLCSLLDIVLASNNCVTARKEFGSVNLWN